MNMAKAAIKTSDLPIRGFDPISSGFRFDGCIFIAGGRAPRFPNWGILGFMSQAHKVDAEDKGHNGSGFEANCCEIKIYENH